MGETLYTLSTAMGRIGLLDYKRELLPQQYSNAIEALWADALFRENKDSRIRQIRTGNQNETRKGKTRNIHLFRVHALLWSNSKW